MDVRTALRLLRGLAFAQVALNLLAGVLFFAALSGCEAIPKGSAIELGVDVEDEQGRSIGGHIRYERESETPDETIYRVAEPTPPAAKKVPKRIRVKKAKPKPAEPKPTEPAAAPEDQEPPDPPEFMWQKIRRERAAWSKPGAPK